MGQHFRGIAFVWILAIAGVACAPKAVAVSYEEYFVAACAAWDSLFTAVGNPDTGSDSDLSRSLDAAIAAGDVASAQRAAEAIAMELKAGREQAAIARRWAPRSAMMVQFDRVLGAYEAGTAAKLAVAKHEPNAVDPQKAFEQAGGLEAWFAMIEAGRAAGLDKAGSGARQCANSITP